MQKVLYTYGISRKKAGKDGEGGGGLWGCTGGRIQRKYLQGLALEAIQMTLTMMKRSCRYFTADNFLKRVS